MYEAILMIPHNFVYIWS